jgi:hypothetical protein
MMIAGGDIAELGAGAIECCRQSLENEQCWRG